jgi:uncharacterized membrane protein YgdD (TMEM256/DUF423 family)
MINLTSFLRWMIVLASLNAAAAVASGAVGAHALESELGSELSAVYSTAVQYHMYHALGLFAVALVAYLLPASIWVQVSGWSMLAGIALFSGSLYALSLSGIRWLGAITPMGGILLIASWVMLAVGALKAASGSASRCENHWSSRSSRK